MIAGRIIKVYQSDILNDFLNDILNDQRLLWRH